MRIIVQIGTCTQVPKGNAASASEQTNIEVNDPPVESIGGHGLAIRLIWAAWATYSCYRGWATGKLDRAIALPSVVRTVFGAVVGNWLKLHPQPEVAGRELVEALRTIALINSVVPTHAFVLTAA